MIFSRYVWHRPAQSLSVSGSRAPGVAGMPAVRRASARCVSGTPSSKLIRMAGRSRTFPGFTRPARSTPIRLPLLAHRSPPHGRVTYPRDASKALHARGRGVGGAVRRRRLFDVDAGNEGRIVAHRERPGCQLRHADQPRHADRRLLAARGTQRRIRPLGVGRVHRAEGDHWNGDGRVVGALVAPFSDRECPPGVLARCGRSPAQVLRSPTTCHPDGGVPGSGSVCVAATTSGTTPDRCPECGAVPAAKGERA